MTEFRKSFYKQYYKPMQLIRFQKDILYEHRYNKYSTAKSLPIVTGRYQPDSSAILSTLY